ncbi:MAG: PilZ domain-containing protein [Acidobacteriota bacterium]|nr:PilZ domain-containing protein [Acidobacteriota bacterium]
MPAVVVAASNLMASLCERLSGEGELHKFSDTEPIQALQAILEGRPDVIVLERLFAATPRGAALINRIRTDPNLGGSEVRVMSHTGDYVRQVARPAASVAAGAGVDKVAAGLSVASPAAAPEAPARGLDWHGTRRAPRTRMRGGVEIQLDGNPATVVDVSTVGAQVVSNTILRPNQKVRVSIPQEDTLVRCRGTVAWAKFELPKPSAPPVYRAGVEFIDVDAAAVDEFRTRNRQ